MKILIACEYSGIVRDAFIKKGHNAMSCDLLPTESPGPHYQGDVMDIINDGFDMMIAHPPCQYLSFAAAPIRNNPERIEKRKKAMDFFIKLWNAPINQICIENPQGEPMIHIKKYQRIEPFYFGEPHRKRTLIWLKNLPPLVMWLINPKGIIPIRYGPIRKIGPRKGYKRGIYFMSLVNGKDRSKRRSKFFPGIAKAMADQWT